MNADYELELNVMIVKTVTVVN